MYDVTSKIAWLLIPAAATGYNLERTNSHDSGPL